MAERDGYATPWQFGGRQDYGDVLRTLRKMSWLTHVAGRRCETAFRFLRT